MFTQIDVSGLDALRSDGHIALIDVRTDAEVERGVIKGTRHIPLHALPQRAGELNPAATTVIYCQSGGRSAQACAFLASQGFSNLHNLQGGILGWLRAGLELVALDK
ncbi:MAG: rhodanese-like domain-containing protein [Betaproteobacteria bacterium]|nr:rhodanese-like domain-containing protein [Betaproteobacteria bacterium]